MDAAKLNEAFEEGSFDAAVTCYTLRNFPDSKPLENMVRRGNRAGRSRSWTRSACGAFGWLLRAWLQ